MTIAQWIFDNSQHLEVEERSWTDDDLDLLVRRRSLVLFTGEALEPWGDAPRVNRLVFIGRNLDRDALLASFESCLDETQA